MIYFIRLLHEERSRLALNFLFELQGEIHNSLFVRDAISIDSSKSMFYKILIENYSLFGPGKNFVEVVRSAKEGIGIDIIL